MYFRRGQRIENSMGLCVAWFVCIAHQSSSVTKPAESAASTVKDLIEPCLRACLKIVSSCMHADAAHAGSAALCAEQRALNFIGLEVQCV